MKYSVTQVHFCIHHCMCQDNDIIMTSCETFDQPSMLPYITNLKFKTTQVCLSARCLINYNKILLCVRNLKQKINSQLLSQHVCQHNPMTVLIKSLRVMLFILLYERLMTQPYMERTRPSHPLVKPTE